jgi:cell division protein FtsQ
VDGRGREPVALKTPRSLHLRSPFDRRIANLKRWLLRNRIPVRLGMVLVAAGILFGLVKVEIPGRLLAFCETLKSRLGGTAGLTVRRITIAGLDNLNTADMRKTLAIAPRTGLYDVDVGAARTRLLANPWVADATILRVPPERLHILIRERIPAILWQHDKVFDAVDAAGNVIARVDPARYPDLYHVVGAGAPEAAPSLIEELAANPIVAGHFRSAVFVGGRRWDLHFDNHLVIELPDRGLTQALEIVSRMITEEDLLDHDILVLDLRDPRAPRLRPKKEAARLKPMPGQDT